MVVSDTKQSVCIINLNTFLKHQKLTATFPQKITPGDWCGGVPHTDINDGGGALDVNTPEGGQPGEVRVEQSHWSRSVQILCSHWHQPQQHHDPRNLGPRMLHSAEIIT